MARQKLTALPAAAFHILLALVDEDLHGYGIMRRVADDTDGRVRLGPGTLYTSIKSLLEEKLIVEIDPPAGSGTADERRRYYRLTTAGLKLARREAERLADLMRIARSRNILGGEHG
ncbi:MAG TPA: helix-turn-helix transcriptional regulator [Candidatus Acidoferrum sp.]|nr:helix-turn-helix transcriptional regulator [Candidatus Acidoferrum sp.]